MQWAPTVMPLVLAAVVILGVLLVVRGRYHVQARYDLQSFLPQLDPRLRLAVLLAAGIPAAWFIVRLLIPVLPVPYPEAVISAFRATAELRFFIPVVLGIVAVLVIGLVARPRPVPGSADLTPRDPMSFVPRSAVVVLAVALAVSAALAVVLGRASTPSPVGRGSVYVVEGSNGGASMSVYGWAESVPTLIALGVLLAATWAMLALIARPGIAPQADVDRAERRYRSMSVLAVALAAVLGHLAAVVRNTAAVAGLEVTRHSHAGTESSAPWFAPLGSTLELASGVLATAALVLWVMVSLTALPRQRDSSDAPGPS